MGAFDPIRKAPPSAPGLLIGLAAFAAAAGLFFIGPWLSAAVLAGFVAICFAAPFFPGAGIFLPVIRRGDKGGKAVALTFDDGPHPRTTPLLLKLLDRHGVQATFFVTGQNAQNHPDLIRKILDSGHCIGNHTQTHDVFVMLKTVKKLALEIDFAQETLKSFGITPLAFRPPAGVINPKLGPVLAGREMVCVHYSRRGTDMGNRRIRGLSEKILKKIKPGDIVLLHDTCPDPKNFQTEKWLAEIEQILKGIPNKDLRIIPLSRLINRPVMLRKQA